MIWGIAQNVMCQAADLRPMQGISTEYLVNLIGQPGAFNPGGLERKY